MLRSVVMMINIITTTSNAAFNFPTQGREKLCHRAQLKDFVCIIFTIRTVTGPVPKTWCLMIFLTSSESQKTVQNFWFKTLLIIHVSAYLPYETGINPLRHLTH
jgi:hypothetical protein